MSDELKNKSGKVKVMYVRSDDDSDKRTHNPRTGKGEVVQENLVLTAAAALRVTNETAAATIANVTTVSVTIASAMIFIVTMRLRGVPFPVLLAMRPPVKEDHGGISGKSFIDPEVLRRQRAEETRVYGENACQALFQSRPEAIVRAWFIQSVTPRFKEALRWMAANRKAYHLWWTKPSWRKLPAPSTTAGSAS
ncbi:tRNA/rRNA methyltransferase yfiF [Klebsiella variicola]|uniref:tRNA/rRNA methyltransferase yfiF n=1 Tax=Klebsiella variicola TaxID=244366 RepID=A0A7H4MQH6_KLEVA|nr:tRNA/rRNA methyltransferase yfiF [Klebsiella variicola]